MYPQAISHGNILTFTPPGFNQTLNVKFPDSRLAVCEKCKKNYKTRDMCRVRNNHTGAPWTTAYICITLDASCTDDNGAYIDKPMTVRMVQWQPFCVKLPFDPKTPVCSSCKKTNRTRSFCRERHQHRQLPWCTVYVMLSAVESTDPSTVVAAPSKPIDGKCEEEGDVSTEGTNSSQNCEINIEGTEIEGGGDNSEEKKTEHSIAKVEPLVNDNVPSAAKEEELRKSDKKKIPLSKKFLVDGEGDDTNDIDENRTFLAKVSCRSSSIHWLELAEYDPSSAPATMNSEGHVQALNAAIRNPAVTMPVDPFQYYDQMAAMGYTPQQIQAVMMQNQHFYQMQRQHQQHYAAQHAAWQAQYNMRAQLAGQPQQGVPPAPGAVAQIDQLVAVPGSIPQASSVAATPGMPAMLPGPDAQQSEQMNENGTITAGQAAAAKHQEIKLENVKQSGENSSENAVALQPDITQTAGAAAQQQAQWQAQMMYQQQLYQQQYQMQLAAQQGMAMPQAGGPAPGTGESQQDVHNQTEFQHDISDEFPDIKEECEESDAKRPRMENV